MISMKKFMDVGIVHFMAYPQTIRGEGPILETIKKIAVDDYFDAIEVTWMKDDEIRKKAHDLIKTSKLKVRYGAQPRLLTTGLNPNHVDEAERVKAEQTLIEAIDEAEELGCPGIAFLSGKYEEETKDHAFESLVKTTNNLCEYAQKKSMNVVLEIFDYDIDKKSLIGPTSLAKKFTDRIKANYSNFGLMVDLSHIPMYHESLTQSLDPIKDDIVHIHIGNTIIDDESHTGYGDQHVYFGYDYSENDIEEVRAFLQHCIDIGLLSSNNKKIVSFEVKPFGDEDADAVVANAKRTLNQAWLQINV